MYLSFSVPFPNGHRFEYKQDTTHVDEFFMRRDMYGFCGEQPNFEACTLYISVSAYQTAKYDLVVFSSASRGDRLCARGCEWKALGDGRCQSKCNTSACYFDLSDCKAGASGCQAACKLEWLGDGKCDEACFNEMCGWDAEDC